MKLPLPSLVCLATAVAFAPSVRAQRVETPPVPTKAEAAKAALDAERDKDKGVVVMNVFEVAAENDDEYRAANTTTGTRYNTPVKDLPMNIEVLTPAFLRDIGALDVRDALEYVSGIQLDNTTAANASRDNPENSTLLIRGISAGMKKDGFARFVPMDPITISRVDIIKGPGGALYGQNGTGGVVNSSSVLAGSRPVFRLGSTVGSYDFRRIEFLGSMSFGPNNRFGIALPMSYQENKSSAMYFETNTFVMNPAVTIKVGPKTQIMASIESRFNTRDNIRGFFLTDNTLAPNGTPYGSLIAGRPGTARVLTTPNQRDFRFEGPDTFRKERTYVRTYRIDHSFSDNLQWWGGFSEEDINVRDRSLSIALRNANDASIPLRVRNDPRYLALLRPSAGTAQPQVLDIRPNNVTNSARTVRPTWKSELYFAFDTGPVKHRMITGISYGPLRSGNNAPNQNFYYGNTGQATNPATVAWENVPVDAVLARFRSPTDYTSVQRWNYSAFNQYPQGPESAIGTTASYLTSHFWDRNLYANLQSSFFKDRLQTIVGFFDTRNDRGGNVYDVNGKFLWNGPAPAGSPAGTPNGVRRPEPVRNSSPSVTVIWLANDWLRLYVNSMSALDPGPAYSGYDGNGKALTAAAVKNAEAGVRLDLFKSKLLLNVVGFTMQDRDRPVNYGAAIQNLLVAPTGTTNGSGFGAFVNTGTDSKGFDLKVDYIPLRNLRINVGFSQNDVKIVQIDPFATPANPDPVRLAAQQRFVAAGGSSSRYLGKPSTDIAKYSGTGFIRYQIATGPLKDVWAMIGAKYLGAREAEIISVSTATGDATITRFAVPDHYLFDFNVGYRRKIGRYNTSFQLNTSNIADDEDFYGATWQVGRTYRFSATLNF
ncbi:MAG TPA: TonB-dependent receptor plug domain-containing protein [Opitutaceae bacterium]|jgi:outer membrane receptor protein involved in Fe transport|nr:TonB-dependent receptor plug domain-containing protein [Opitutaceae bacterium]